MPCCGPCGAHFSTYLAPISVLPRPLVTCSSRGGRISLCIRDAPIGTPNLRSKPLTFLACARDEKKTYMSGVLQQMNNITNRSK